ncbi:YpoC family protein [Actinomycetes bacterium NPDC127524]
MNGKQLLFVPEALFHPLYDHEAKSIEVQDFQIWRFPDAAIPFPYEMLYGNGVEGYQPWSSPEIPIKDILKEWKKSEQSIRLLFAGRYAKEAHEPMKQAMSWLLSSLFWLNGIPVNLKDLQREAGEFAVKPVNAIERLQFILSSPSHFSSFIQLSELMQELEKQFYKTLALRNIRS